MERDRHLGDFRAVKRGLDDHLRREFHARAGLLQAQIMRLREAAQTAVHIDDRHLEHDARECREKRVAEPAMKWRHRTGKHLTSASRQPAALNEVEPLA
jgi:hypothetical protein